MRFLRRREPVAARKPKMYRALHPECCLFQQRLEDGVGSVFVELDAYLGPQLVRKVVQLPTSSHRHQQSLRLLLNSKLRNVHGAWY